MAVADTAITVAPANWTNGIAAMRATATHDPMGVWSFGLTFASRLENGSWSSRDMPKHRRIVEVMIDMQQTKIAAETISRYTVAMALEKFSSMIVFGYVVRLGAAFTRFGIAISVPHRK